MHCPHCLYAIRPDINNTEITRNKDRIWEVEDSMCPNCGMEILKLKGFRRGDFPIKLIYENYIFPKTIQNKPLPPEVEDLTVVSDYNEAYLVLSDSPKSSAALSRRCLQYVLREKLSTTAKELSKQIEEVIDAQQLPPEM